MIGSVYPVDYVQSSVDTKEKHIMSSKILYFSVSLKEYQLWDNRQGLQVYREIPTQLVDIKPDVKICNNCKEKTRESSEFPMQK
mmetsp:Transcript_431/g.696  ORF Transcript_431/g.696 Transcript_431/m.696 type:complete len:84 (-) Transcript_431:329-580(-)